MATSNSTPKSILDNLLTSGQKTLAHSSTLSPWKNTPNATFLLLSAFIATLTPLFAPRSLPRRGLFTLHLVLLCQAFLARAPPQVTNPAILYTSGVLLGVVSARAFDRLWFCIPEEKFHRLIKKKRTTTQNDHGKKNGEKPTVEYEFVKEDALTLPPFQRWLWALELATVTRGIGWDWRISGIPAHTLRSRRNFVVFSLLQLGAMYTGLYLISYFSRAILNGFEDVGNPQLRERLVWVMGNTVVLYIVIAAGWAMTIYSHFGMLMFPLAILCVGLRVGPQSWQEVEAWPPNFGNWREAYSIRRWWGPFSAQRLLAPTTPPRRQHPRHSPPIPALLPEPKILFSPLPIRLFKRYAHLLLTFFISGAIHSCGTFNISRSPALSQHVPFSPIAGTDIDLYFYLLQGVGIMLEDFTCWTLGINDQSAQPPTQLRRWLGYAVAITFHIYTRVVWKAVPLARAHGFVDGRGEVYAALSAMEVGASAVPGNFVRLGVEQWMGSR
ncbi:hypothetical protein G7Y89_g1540 [Cudoniella acicularis]|uniref:Wax synthase domain-containing protein n=1 Tax=Cudoniella acicularis TaxID=354080 RepID=A0A8H4W6X7_9HELO|nr:hypothetical protein G7Y89_g1540 [Cudoniella acicularis]